MLFEVDNKKKKKKKKKKKQFLSKCWNSKKFNKTQVVIENGIKFTIRFIYWAWFQ